MHRIDSDTKEIDKHGTGKHGFTEGNPATGVAPTQTTEEWFDAVQEEIAGVVEDAGIALDKTDNTQLLQAIEIKARRNLVVANWTERTHSRNFDLHGVAAGLTTSFGYRAVAVGEADGGDAYVLMSSSTRGGVWGEQTNPNSLTLNGVVWDPTNAIFVAVGEPDTSAYLITAPEGFTWARRTTPTKAVALNAVAVDSAGLFCAVGDLEGAADSYILTSPDGTTWTERAAPANFNLYGVAWGGGVWCAVGAADGTDAHIITSTDAGTSTAWADQSNPDNVDLHSVAYGNGIFVAVGAQTTGPTEAYIITSPDGVTWTRRTNGIGEILRGVTYDGIGYFVAVGDTGSIWTSPDGSNWEERTCPVSAKDLLGVTYTDRNFIAVGNNGAGASPGLIVTSLYE